MEIGLALPQHDGSLLGQDRLSWDTVVAWARRAEALGFASLWLADALPLASGEDAGAGGHRWLEPLVALAALARVTTTARLGTFFLAAARRPPGVLAKALATLDVVSAGRLTVGVGAGTSAPGVPSSAPAPAEQLAEVVQILAGSFTGGPFSFAGRHHRVDGLRCRPRPLQDPRPPIWVVGDDDGTVAVAARHADGWNPGRWWGSLEAYRDRLAVLVRVCEQAGRDPDTVTRSLSRAALVGEDDADLARRWDRLRAATPPGALPARSLDDYREGRLVGTVDQVREQVAGWAAAGVTTLVVDLGAVAFSVTSSDDLELLVSATS